MTGGGIGYHTPVMVAEVLEWLKPERGGLYFDGTLGGGGHAAAILAVGTEVRLIGVDRDEEALEVARRRLASFGSRAVVRGGDYAAVAETLADPLAGALLDLGLSSRQVDEERRGFSFGRGVPLDMRMSQGAGPTAGELLNTLPEPELADVFYEYGEERRSRRLAAEVVRRRGDRPFETADDLVAVLHRVFGDRVSARTKARIFQALRIRVNDELRQLERALPVLRDRLVVGGVLVVISYHSLEDRRVKERFRAWSKGCVCPPDLPVCACGLEPSGRELTRKPVVPTAEEVLANPRARSAKLRAWRKAA